MLDGRETKIGVSLYDLGNEYQRFGLTGAVVQSVEEGSPAAAAGLQQNDIIIEVNGTDISGTSDFKNMISGAEDGEVLTLSIYRQGETVEVKVELTLRRQSALDLSMQTIREIIQESISASEGK